jgi:aspartate racemase
MALDEVTVQNERAHVATAAETGPADSDRIGRTVARIWQELLSAPLRSPEDDFFEAGGDSLKALTFVMELEHALDLELSLTVITAGAGVPPLFFIHDVGGSVAGLFPVARRMTYSGAVIGIQARGLSKQEPPNTTVEAMAAEYLREIKRWQPDGPYYLCGYSFRGLVAFEMARRLCQSGDKVGLVGLFDTAVSPRDGRSIAGSLSCAGG